jgi:recombination protein RecT
MSSANLKAVATGQAVETKNPVAIFRGLLEKNRAQLVAALPRHMTPDRMIRLACTEFAKNPKLQDCTQVSVFGAIIQGSQLGLEIGVLGQAYLVPFKRSFKEGSVWREVWECQLIPGYKGLLSLARRSGEVTSIETNIVYERDTFDLRLGIDSKIDHVPYLDGDRGKARLVYGVAKFKDGGHHLEWMTIGDVERIKAQVFTRNRLTNESKSPWNTDYEQMVRKTLIRRMANYLPMSVELSAALAMDNAADTGKGVTLDADFVVTETSGDAQEGGDEPQTSGASASAADQGGQAAAGDKVPDVEPPTYAEVNELLAKAETMDALDFARSHIAKVADETQRAELNAAASARLKAIRTGK